MRRTARGKITTEEKTAAIHGAINMLAPARHRDSEKLGARAPGAWALDLPVDWLSEYYMSPRQS